MYLMNGFDWPRAVQDVVWVLSHLAFKIFKRINITNEILLSIHLSPFLDLNAKNVINTRVNNYEKRSPYSRLT